MTENALEPPTNSSAPVSRRYQSINVPDGELVIFDGENQDSWIQSDAYFAVGAMY